MDNLTIIVPFFNGHATIRKLLDCIPPSAAPILIVDDLSDEPYKLNREGIEVVRLKKKGYFTGTVNYGLSHTTTDVLVLNQDAYFSSDEWIKFLEGYRKNYAMIGERIKGVHPAWGGYIQGTFMFIRRDVIDKVGLMNEKDYPLWGSTCEYQARVCRENMPILMVEEIPGFIHQREGRFGAAITTILKREPMRKAKYIRTPPEVSVIIPCYNYGKYLPSAVNSLVGGKTDLGEVPQQTFASFEVVIVDDGSTDSSDMIIRKLINPQKGVRSVHRDKTEGTAVAINTGIENSFGRYITILGADDMRKPDALEKLYRAQLKNLHSFIYDEVEAFGDGRLKLELHFGVSPYNFERLLFKNHIHAGIMFPRRAWEEVGGYPEAFSDGREDWAMNVTLGIHGYCGILLEGYKGYLYRREGHNRSSRNGNQRAIFLGKLKLLYPEIYAGDRPEMCCGDKRRTINPKSKVTHRKGVVLMNTETSVLLEYVGDNYGKASFYGLSTGNQYRAGKSHKIVAVDKRDLNGSTAKPGLLDLKEKGKPIFRLYQLPQKVVPVPVLKKVIKATPKIAADDANDDLGQVVPLKKFPGLKDAVTTGYKKPTVKKATTKK